ncbi:Hypothetical protein, putative [Bodo saltans]|uniref:SET domain-containing protein n=1 Tax=Bodo saltans TaxID=75058 RepID=A0A0S4J7S5_BODSA|nr:Hypothetical protein, putative [Bodo saltans]|eukprot:CUG86216.1 Hypothetical protein, putative [Bodo saltans]
MSKSEIRTQISTSIISNDDRSPYPTDDAEWTVNKHVSIFAPTGNISLLDMRHVHAGWSLRIKQPVKEMSSQPSSSTTLIDIPWDHVLDKKKCEAFMLALHRLLLMDGSIDDDVDVLPEAAGSHINQQRASRRLLREFFLSTLCDAKPELLFASALLAEKQIRENPSPVFDGIVEEDLPCPPTAPRSPLPSDAASVLRDAAATIRRFSRHFQWIHGVVDECGDLGIPLLWGDSLLNEQQPSSASYLSLFCDAAMEQRVTQDVSTLKTLKVSFDNVWAHQGLLPRTLLPDDRTNLFGTMSEVLRYVAWIRSRWVCFLTPDEDDDDVSNGSKKKDKGKATKKKQNVRVTKQPTRNRSSFAVCPLIEKLNHHSESLICPTVNVGVNVAVIVDQTIRGDAAAANQLRCAGDEIFITYGGHTNAYLLEHYGFLMAPAYTNPSEALHLQLPTIAAAAVVCPPVSSSASVISAEPLRESAMPLLLLDRWCIASDSMASQWTFAPKRPATTGGGIPPSASSVPVAVMFSVAVTRCLELLEGWGLVAPPTTTLSSKKTSDEGLDEDGGCFHLGCLGEGDSDDSDLDDAGGSWFYDADRMRRFIAKKDLEISAKLSTFDHLNPIDDGPSSSANGIPKIVVQAFLEMGNAFSLTHPLTSLVLSELEKLVQNDVVIPAVLLLQRVSEWQSAGVTKEMLKRIEGSQCSVFWASTYAEERRKIGEEMLNTIENHRAEIQRVKTL